MSSEQLPHNFILHGFCYNLSWNFPLVFAIFKHTHAHIRINAENMFLFGQTIIRSDSFHPKTKCSLISIFARKNTLIPRKYNNNIFVVVKELVGQFQTMPTFVENILNGGLEWMECWWWLFSVSPGTRVTRPFFRRYFNELQIQFHFSIQKVHKEKQKDAWGHTSSRTCQGLQ